MKTLFLFLSTLCFSVYSQAASIEIIGACESTPVFQGDSPLTAPTTVGAMTIAILEANQIPYVGTEEGFNSILGTPTGLEAIEFLNSTDLRAYGWCYSVDGFEPGEMPGEFVLKGPEHIKWWYAFSLKKGDQWVSYCEPAYTVKPQKICAPK